MDIYGELNRIANLYPLTQSMVAELANLRLATPALLDPQKQKLREQRHSHMSRQEIAEENDRLQKQIMQQHIRETQKSASVIFSPSEAAISVIQEQMKLVDTFLSISASEEMRQAAWPSYDLYSDEYIRMVILSALEFVTTTQNHVKTANNQPTQITLSGGYENINTTFPEHIVSPEDDITGLVFSNSLSIEPRQITLDALLVLQPPEPVSAIASINFEGLDQITLSNDGKMTNYDKEVYKAICSLYVEGKNQFITLQMIYRTMTGNPSGKITEATKAHITDTIKRITRLRILVETPDKSTGSERDKAAWEIDSLVLNATIVSKKLNGVKVDFCIKVFDVPILYHYASIVNRVSRIETKLLKTPINKTEDVIVLQGYLLICIDSMKTNPAANRVISYDDLYTYVIGTDEYLNRKRRAQIRTSAKIMLEFWKEQQFITDFCEITKKDRTISGIHVDI